MRRSLSPIAVSYRALARRARTSTDWRRLVASLSSWFNLLRRTEAPQLPKR